MGLVLGDKKNVGLQVGFLNKDNQPFYSSLTPEVLEQFLVASGLSCNSDVASVIPEIKDTKSLLEVGAGFGRVIQGLIDHGYKGSIHALENEPKMCAYLQNFFGNQIQVHQQSLFELSTKEKFDAILWLWSGIADFSACEQQACINKLASFLSKAGKLVIDVLLAEQNTPSTLCFKGNNFVTQNNGFKMCGHIPSMKEVLMYTMKANLRFKDVIYYEAGNNIQRASLIFTL